MSQDLVKALAEGGAAQARKALLDQLDDRGGCLEPEGSPALRPLGSTGLQPRPPETGWWQGEVGVDRLRVVKEPADDVEGVWHAPAHVALSGTLGAFTSSLFAKSPGRIRLQVGHNAREVPTPTGLVTAPWTEPQYARCPCQPPTSNPKQTLGLRIAPIGAGWGGSGPAQAQGAHTGGGTHQPRHDSRSANSKRARWAASPRSTGSLIP